MFTRQIQMAMAIFSCILSGSQAAEIGSTSSSLGLLNMKQATSKMTLLAEYPLGNPNLKQPIVHIYATSHALVRRDIRRDSSGRIIIDMTPSKCTKQDCYDGAFQAPLEADCNAIVEAQLYNSTGQLTAFPGTFVYVTIGTCAVVFQNPIATAAYTLDYTWASLGTIVQNIQKKCLSSTTKLAIGGICEIQNYLHYTLDNVAISVQRIALP